jgi:hypothetical protein
VNGVVGWDLYEKSGINADRMVEFLEKHITNEFKIKSLFWITQVAIETQK